MLYTIIACFALAAVLGLFLISYVLRGQQTPRIALILHGLFAATALGLLINYTLSDKPGPLEALVLFLIAAFGGFIMVSRDLTGHAIPKWLAVVHGLVAIGGFAFLVVFAMNK
jgi:hypothetical protein